MDSEIYVSDTETNEIIRIPKIDDLCVALKKKFELQEKENRRLCEENEKLKNGIWGKEEVKKLKEDYDRMKREYHQGFPISDEEKKEIDKWVSTHDCRFKNSIRGFHYDIQPTSLGTSMIITCDCGKSFEFRTID